MYRSRNDLPKIEKSDIVHEGFFKVRKERLRYSATKERDYYTLITPPIALMVLAQTEEGLYLINRTRHPTGQFLLSCPGGVKREKEDPQKAAARELHEETGYQAPTYRFLGEAYPFPGIALQKIIYFKAERAKKVSDPTLEPSEIIESHLFSRHDLLKMIKEGTPTDGLLCTALFLKTYRRHNLKLVQSRSFPIKRRI